MKPEVSDQFPALTRLYEGDIPWMYLDVKRLVTVGLGCLLPDPRSASCLPFVTGTGSLASAAEIEAEWRTLKNHEHADEIARLGAGCARQFVRLRLPRLAIDDLCRQRLATNELIVAHDFPQWDSWPAEVQLAVMSFCWAVGAGFRHSKTASGAPMWPKLVTALDAKDWKTAADECKLRESNNPGVVPRNKANRRLFLAAAEPVGITDEDRSRIEYLQSLWFVQMRDEMFNGGTNQEPST
jgi:hypothetical protein